MTLMPQRNAHTHTLSEEVWSEKIKVTKLKCQPNGGDQKQIYMYVEENA